METSRYLDIDFYQVEKDRDGHSIIHDNGYCYGTEDGYDEDGNVSEDYCYRVVEFCGLYLDPTKLREADGDEYYDIMQENCKQYISDITEKECDDILLSWLKGDVTVYENGEEKTVSRGCVHLSMSDVTDETPEGWYCNAREEVA